MPIRPHTGPPLVTTFESAMIVAPPSALGLDPFYTKYADAFGIPIVSSELVPDAALLLARDIGLEQPRARHGRQRHVCG